jgi:hypothetical protein
VRPTPCPPLPQLIGTVLLNSYTLATLPDGRLPNVTFALVLTGAVNVVVDPSASVLLVTVVPLPSNTVQPPLPNPPQPLMDPFYDPFVPLRAPVTITLSAPQGLPGKGDGSSITCAGAGGHTHVAPNTRQPATVCLPDAHAHVLLVPLGDCAAVCVMNP